MFVDLHYNISFSIPEKGHFIFLCNISLSYTYSNKYIYILFQLITTAFEAIPVNIGLTFSEEVW